MPGRSVWGWGHEEEAVEGEERDALAELIRTRFELSEVPWAEPPDPDGLDLPAPRVRPRGGLAEICSTSPRDRAGHAYGKAFRDVARSLRGEYPHPPDVVAFPRSEEDVARLLEWCVRDGVAAIPYGGGSSVVGGVEPETDRPTVTIDLREMGSVLEVDERSRAARIQGGALGPAIEEALRRHGLTLRHYPQSHEFSTLGGWIATRSAGHHATLVTHIEDRVESVRLVTPAGVLETPRLPASGAGPDPNRLVAGSEGTLGVITEAWVRVLPRPAVRASTTARFPSFEAGLEAARAIGASSLHPATCRLLDPEEALVGGAGDGRDAVLLLGFESPGPPLDERLEGAVELCRDHGGTAAEESAGDAWRASFLRAPYLRDALVRMGMVVESFETATTWDRLEALHGTVTRAARDAAGDPAMVTTRLTHVYPDGAAPYFTVLVPAGDADPVERWDGIKHAVSEAILAAGGTITHHHAVGRVHRPWYERERPDLFAVALRAAKEALDPAGIMNPGALL